MENNICNSMIFTSRRRHFYLVGQSKHKVGACGVNNQASAVLAENRLKANSEREEDSPVEMGASNISRFKEMPFLKAKRHRAHSVVSGVRVKVPSCVSYRRFFYFLPGSSEYFFLHLVIVGFSAPAILLPSLPLTGFSGKGLPYFSW
ncbi:hypothetical protein TNCV_696621 [Trichonephila clavipes]|nr:hypothetical protein TNCV_696621 [Trichonephila clavipes]